MNIHSVYLACDNYHTDSKHEDSCTAVLLIVRLPDFVSLNCLGTINLSEKPDECMDEVFNLK